jgi:hypothetical protein
MTINIKLCSYLTLIAEVPNILVYKVMHYSKYLHSIPPFASVQLPEQLPEFLSPY